MPIYEYKCQACHNIQEFIMKVKDPAPESCPLCGQGPLDKQMSRTHFVLKGSGWYETDFKPAKNSGTSGAAASTSTGGAAGGGGGTDATPSSTTSNGKEAAPAGSDTATKAVSGPADGGKPSEQSLKSESAACAGPCHPG